MVRAENLSGQQSADVAQVKPLLEDGGSVVADLLFLRWEAGISHGIVILASVGRGEVLCRLISNLLFSLAAKVKGFSL